MLNQTGDNGRFGERVLRADGVSALLGPIVIALLEHVATLDDLEALLASLRKQRQSLYDTDALLLQVSPEQKESAVIALDILLRRIEEAYWERGNPS